METIYSELLSACLTVAIAWTYKRLSERPVPIRELVPDKKQRDKTEIKLSA